MAWSHLEKGEDYQKCYCIMIRSSVKGGRCREFVPTLLFFIGASRAAAVSRFQTVVLAVQITVQTTVDIQVGVTAEQTRLI